MPASAAAVPGVTATTTVYSGQFEVRQLAVHAHGGIHRRTWPARVILRMTAGTSAALAQGELLIDSTTATAKHLAVGDTRPGDGSP